MPSFYRAPLPVAFTGLKHTDGEVIRRTGNGKTVDTGSLVKISPSFRLLASKCHEFY